MTKIAVVYHSATGRTKALAEACVRGALEVEGTSALLLSIDEPRLLHVLSDADAIVFGCPTYMGSASGAFKTFMDSTSAIWALQGWRDKIAAAFTHSAAPSGDKLGTLVQLAIFAAQHGMVWLGLGLPPTYASVETPAEDTNRLGSHLGAMAQSRPGGGVLPEGDLRTVAILGRRVAAATQRWQASPAVPTTERHETTRGWSFPPERPAPPNGIERTNLRELVARPERFEHHLLVCASVDGVQLEVVTASEPLYFAHINLSDEYAVALPSGDELVDRFPLRTFISEAETHADVGRYNHRVGDLVLHPEGFLHWPGRLRAPYEPFDFPPGMRRTGLSLVYCANRPIRSSATPLPIAPERHGDVKAYREPAPPMALASLRGLPGPLAAIGSTTLTLVEAPRTIALPRGGWVVVLEAIPGGAHAACDLYRVPRGATLDAEGITRALVFASSTAEPDPAPPTWTTVPAAPFAPFEDGVRGRLPVLVSSLTMAEQSPTTVKVTIGTTAADVPRYWLARMLYRVALHGLRLGYVETYERFFVDDRDPLRVRIGIGAASVSVPRREALAVIERLYRAVAPDGYRERLT